jgi:hypothetical protein
MQTTNKNKNLTNNKYLTYKKLLENDEILIHHSIKKKIMKLSTKRLQENTIF